MNTTSTSGFYQLNSFINYKESDSTLVEPGFDLSKEKMEIKSMKKVNPTEIEEIIPEIGIFYHQLANELSSSITQEDKIDPGYHKCSMRRERML